PHTKGSRQEHAVLRLPTVAKSRSSSPTRTSNLGDETISLVRKRAFSPDRGRYNTACNNASFLPSSSFSHDTTALSDQPSPAPPYCPVLRGRRWCGPGFTIYVRHGALRLVRVSAPYISCHCRGVLAWTRHRAALRGPGHGHFGSPALGRWRSGGLVSILGGCPNVFLRPNFR